MRPPSPDLLIDVGAGRRFALDDRGDAGGRPVLYLHGTPDSRLSRHPDDSLAGEAGIRLLSPDRPGIGRSDPDPHATPVSIADDLIAVLDHLGIGEAGVLAWSAGAIHALALAGSHPDRITQVTLAAPLVPADAYRDADVLVGSGDGRQLFAEALATTAPDELGRELAPWLVPYPIDRGAAEAHLAEAIAAVATVEGAGHRLVDGLMQALGQGLGGLERDLAAQATPLGRLLDAISCQVSVYVGDTDAVCPPPMATWVAQRTGGTVEVVPGAGHELAITRWGPLVRSFR